MLEIAQTARYALARAASRVSQKSVPAGDPRSVAYRRETGRMCSTGPKMITAFGVLALTFMMAMYALEDRAPGFVVAFALGCVLSSVYGFLAGAWPFGVVELIWAIVALRRWRARLPSR